MPFDKGRPNVRYRGQNKAQEFPAENTHKNLSQKQIIGNKNISSDLTNSWQVFPIINKCSEQQ